MYYDTIYVWVYSAVSLMEGKVVFTLFRAICAIYQSLLPFIRRDVYASNRFVRCYDLR